MVFSSPKKSEVDSKFNPAEKVLIQSYSAVTVTTAITAGAAVIILLMLMMKRSSWQAGVLAGLYAITGLYSLAAQRFLLPKLRFGWGIAGTTIFLAAAVIATAAFISDIGIPVAILFLIYSLIISAVSSADDRLSNYAIVLGILTSGVSSLLANFSPVPQVSIGQPAILTITGLGIFLQFHLVMRTRRLVSAPLRIRLMVAIILFVIIPPFILTLVNSQFTSSVVTEQTNRSLEMAARLTAMEIDRFITESQRSVQQAASLDVFSDYLEMPEELREGSPEEQQMQLTLLALDTYKLNNANYLSSFALLDANGKNLFDTYTNRLDEQLKFDFQNLPGLDINLLPQGTGGDESDQVYFQVPYQKGSAYISPVYVLNTTKGYFYISAPVRSSDLSIIGVLRVRYDSQLLQDTVKKFNGLLGENSHAILFDENNIRLVDGYQPHYTYKAVARLSEEKIQKLKAEQRLPDLPSQMLYTDQTGFEAILSNYETNPYFDTQLDDDDAVDENREIGAIVPTSSQPWKVVYMQSDFSTTGLRLEQSRLSGLITVLIAGFASIFAIIGAQLLSAPIIALTKTAQAISQGDLNAQAPYSGSDEFGMMGAAFNLMTTQLRMFINQLEERVQARTQEIEEQNIVLSRRARQLQTVADVAREIVSVQDLETLLTSITQLVSERFGFYHVGIFLLDDAREYAVLRAANSEGGQRMLARHHRLEVGRTGIVGYATGTGRARIATDVGSAAVYFNNPDLPETRSEMALPLKVGEQIIGAIDIQSKEPNAFTRDDIELFTTLADQIAVAIHNNQLFNEMTRALEEAQNVHRQYLREAWTEDTARRKVPGYVYNQSGIVPQQTENPLWSRVFQSGEAVYASLPGESDGLEKAVMAVPIAIRGETIGVIHVQDQGEERTWSEDEIAVVNSIASQVAVALENARLFENTVRRANREKKVLEITAKIRSTNNPEEMMQIAVSELQNALHASRAQIYIRQSTVEENETVENRRNGSRSQHDPGRIAE